MYRVLPQHFSEAAISRMLVLASFTPKTMQTSPDGHTLHWEYHDARGTLVRSLDIAPIYGLIEYHNYRAVDISTNGDEAVPTQAEVERLALGYLQELGGDTNQLCFSPHSGTERHHSVYDKQAKKFIQRTVMRGVMYARKLDGIRFLGAGGRGGFAMDFGRDSGIASLELDWRNVQPLKGCDPATPKDITDWIHNGKAVQAMFSDEPPAHADRLTINRITPYYLGAPGGTPQNIIWPFADVEMVASTGTNTATFHLNCPILSTNAIF